MGQIFLGFQALLRVWNDAAFASQVVRLLAGQSDTPIPEPSPAKIAEPVVAPSTTPIAVVPPGRSDALGLLSVLQREGRLLDFLKEGISGFSDAEIGAAVRPVHKDCAAVVERIFGVQPVSRLEEGQPIEVLAGYDPAQYRVVGPAPGAGTIRGSVAHPGWKATRCELPAYHGRADSAMVIAPVEVEV